MLKTMRKTYHVIDQQEQGHNAGDSYYPDWVVDQEEQSHDEFEPADLIRATDVLSNRKYPEVASVLAEIDTELSGILRAKYIEPRKAGILSSLDKADPASLEADLIGQAVSLIMVMTAKEAAELLTKIGARKAGILFGSISGEQPSAIVKELDPQFIAAMFKSLSR